MPELSHWFVPTPRAAEHFDALDVEEGGVKALLAAQVDAVDIDADALVPGGLVGVEGHDAANADGQRRLARLEGGDAQRRNAAVLKVDQAFDVTVGQLRTAHHRDRDRGLLQVAFAPLGGDHHFRELSGRRRRSRSRIRRRGGRRRAGHRHGEAAPGRCGKQEFHTHYPFVGRVRFQGDRCRADSPIPTWRRQYGSRPPALLIDPLARRCDGQAEVS